MRDLSEYKGKELRQEVRSVSADALYLILRQLSQSHLSLNGSSNFFVYQIIQAHS